MPRSTPLAQADDLVVGQRGMAAVDMADDVGVGLEDDVLVDQAGARDGRAAGVDGALDSVPARPSDHPLGLLAGLDAPEADLAEQPDAGVRKIDEVLLLHPLLDHGRAGVDLHAVRPEVLEGALARDGQGLEADDVPGPARHVHLAGRDHGRHAAVQAAVDPVELALARRPVAGHRVHVAVDQSGTEGRAPGVDDRTGSVRIELVLLAERGDAAVLGDQRIGVENRRVEVAAQHQPDVAHDQLVVLRCPGHGSPPPALLSLLRLAASASSRLSAGRPRPSFRRWSGPPRAAAGARCR